MSDVEACRRKSEELLNQALQLRDAKERARLLMEAVEWQKKAIAALEEERRGTQA